MAVVSIGFCAAGWFFADKALTNDRGLVINGLIHLKADGANVFYWLLALASACFVAIGVLAFIAGLSGSQRLTITDSELSVPKWLFSRAPSVAKLSDVVTLEIRMVQKHRFLNVYLREGKITISESLLPNRSSFDQVHAVLAQKVRLPGNGK